MNNDIQARINELKNAKEEFSKKVTANSRDEIAKKKEELIKMIKDW